MATTKKTVAAKPTVKRKPKTTAKAPVKSAMRSFVLTKDAPPFFSFNVTHQTAYWTILSLLVLVLGVWVVMLNVKINQIYDHVQLNAPDNSFIDKKY
ncbi:MAG TPA: hypothetical protein VLG09_05440 [Candidatus Saccharimonadales bacterium]|nr:hypothetical protein [Candidatus Saccharimonadales bacterium]